MKYRPKLEGSDIWEIYTPAEEEISAMKSESQARRESALLAVREWVMSNLPNLVVKYVDEDGEYSATIPQLEEAVCLASGKDLESFLRKKTIPFNDGYLVVSTGN